MHGRMLYYCNSTLLILLRYTGIAGPARRHGTHTDISRVQRCIVVIGDPRGLRETGGVGPPVERGK
jgi:hypothetical protein